ncbi:MAG: hypothetical protein M3R32_01305 [Chloroflexota bacterium]|nr:hypothetical protein [Chloroflexota bacterium]
MAELRTQITTVRLARDRVRLSFVPATLVLLAAAAVAGGLEVRGPGGISLIVLGAIVALVAAYLAALVSSYRLLVEPGALKLYWLGGVRTYRLVRGSVTRVAVRGREGAALRPRFGALGWAVGPATLRRETPIELVRLSVRPALIMVPTDRGRLAIAAAVESELLAALASAVRLQERLDQIGSRRGMGANVLALPGPAQPAALAATTPLIAPPPSVVAPPQVMTPPSVAPPPPAAPRVLTGIERTLIEQRLAVERAAARAAAEAGLPAPPVEAVPEPVAVTPSVVAQPAEEATAPMAPVEAVAPIAPVAATAARRPRRARRRRPAWLGMPGAASLAAALPILLPLIGAVVAWVAITASGRPALPTGEARLLLAGLALVGPVGAVAGLIARTWYPRLGGLVVASALAALAMLTRTILA